MDGKPLPGIRMGLIWTLTVAALFTLILFSKAVFDGSLSCEKALYQIALFAMCSGSFFLCRKNSDLRFLAFFMSFYYLSFGARELVSWFIPLRDVLSPNLAGLYDSSLSDLLIFLGGVSLLTGYLATTAGRRKRDGWFRRDWDPRLAYRVGLLSWIVGVAALIMVQIVYQSVGKEVGIQSHVISNASYLSLLGGMIIIYLAYKEEHGYLWLTLALMIAFEFVLGFVGDRKEISYRLLLLTVLARFFFTGKFRLTVLAVVVISFIPFQALFTYYRDQVLQVRAETTLYAIKSSGATGAVMEGTSRLNRGMLAKGATTALDRVDCRKYIDVLTANLGDRSPYKKGETLLPVFYSFVPKAIWPDKPELSTGQLFNREFKLSTSHTTFVPTTLLGEFYWNFGMFGGITGMFLLGMTLAVITRSASLSSCTTLGRFLVLILTAYVFGLRFEGTFAVTVSNFIRMAVIIFLLDLIVTRFLGVSHGERRAGRGGLEAL
jgi:hypothetical protein